MHDLTQLVMVTWRVSVARLCCIFLPQVHLLDAFDNQTRPVCVQARSKGLEYFVEHMHGHLLLLTNKPSSSTYSTTSSSDRINTETISSSSLVVAASHSAVGPGAPAGDASDYCLMTVPAAAVFSSHVGADHWRLLIAARSDTVITDMEVFSSCVVLHELAAARPTLTVIRLATKQQQADSQTAHLQVVQQQQVSLNNQHMACRRACCTSGGSTTLS